MKKLKKNNITFKRKRRGKYLNRIRRRNQEQCKKRERMELARQSDVLNDDYQTAVLWAWLLRLFFHVRVLVDFSECDVHSCRVREEDEFRKDIRRDTVISPPFLHFLLSFHYRCPVSHDQYTNMLMFSYHPLLSLKKKIFFFTNPHLFIHFPLMFVTDLLPPILFVHLICSERYIYICIIYLWPPKEIHVQFHYRMCPPKKSWIFDYYSCFYSPFFY